MVFFFSLLLPAAVLADDARTATTDRYASQPLPETSQAYWLDTGYSSSWQLPPTAELSHYSSRATDVIADLDFRDPGPFARASKVRELSLLTLAETGKTRLFFGVNYDGLFGFHFGARPRLGDERCVELARMPYLTSASRGKVAR
jgi:hypothetical protein